MYVQIKDQISVPSDAISINSLNILFTSFENVELGRKESFTTLRVLSHFFKNPKWPPISKMAAII